jgi:hypothetical protein
MAEVGPDRRARNSVTTAVKTAAGQSLEPLHVEDVDERGDQNAPPEHEVDERT